MRLADAQAVKFERDGFPPRISALDRPEAPNTGAGEKRLAARDSRAA